MEEVKNKEVKKQTDAQMEDEIKAAELELRKLEIKSKKAELQDIEERLAEREMKRENKRQRSVTNGATLKTIKNNEEAAQKRCNHRKGGNGAEGLVGGQGDDSQYAILKHQMANGDIWVRCLRCGKTWKPLTKKDFTFEGKFDEAAFNDAMRIYKEALSFQTRNSMSGGVQFRFSDGGEDFREKVASSTLR